MARNTLRVPAVNPTEELIQLAIDLDLTTLAQSLPTLLEGAENESPSFTDFGLKMFRAEVIARKTRRLERSLKRSFAARPKLDPRVVKELLGCRFVTEHRNILCLGRAGLGKTQTRECPFRGEIIEPRNGHDR